MEIALGPKNPIAQSSSLQTGTWIWDYVTESSIRLSIRFTEPLCMLLVPHLEGNQISSYLNVFVNLITNQFPGYTPEPPTTFAKFHYRVPSTVAGFKFAQKVSVPLILGSMSISWHTSLAQRAADGPCCCQWNHHCQRDVGLVNFLLRVDKK
ncbi:Uncharacterized protein TCM_033908 [Theobroma cacao]|uniref:Uncharacterized protein n=1 Tax=Theobroma cacao TaxID=3641 RepID=A0A061FC24_THECC|nr:Uncharacterized protein TCM_033908 [Theobroma cacao]